jgi:hypothetical protein
MLYHEAQHSKPIFWSERKLYKEYDSKSSVEKFSGRESQMVWRQDEPIGSEPPVVN